MVLNAVSDEINESSNDVINDKTIVRITLSITPELSEWCKAHPEVNKSEVLRQALNQVRAGYEVQYSFYGLAFFMLIASSFLVLFWFFIPVKLMALWTTTLIIVVTVILVRSVILFSRFNEEVKNG